MARFLCPNCRGAVEVAGNTVSFPCPGCRTVLQLPSTPAPSSEPAEILARCPHCSRSVSVTRMLAGKIIKCLPQPPGCGRPYVVLDQVAPPTPTVSAPGERSWRPWLWGGGLVAAMALCVGMVIGSGSLFRSRTGPDSSGDPPDPTTVLPRPVGLDPKAPGPPGVKEVKQKPLEDLDFLPGDARGLFSIRIADLWNSPPLQEAWYKLPQHVRDRSDEASRLFGFDLGNFERVTLVVRGGLKRETWAVVKTARPLDAAARARMISGAESKGVKWQAKTYAGFPYQLATAPAGMEGAPPPLAVHVASDSVFVAGPEPDLHAALGHFQKGTRGGDLAHVVDLVAHGKDHLLMAALLDDDDRAELPKATGLLGLVVRGPEGVTASMLQVRFASLVEVKATMTFGKPEQADSIRRQVETAKKLGKRLVQFADAAKKDDPMVKLLEQLTGVRESMKGRNLVIEGEIDLKKVVPQLPDLFGPRVLPEEEIQSGMKHAKSLALAFGKYHDDNGRYPQAITYSKDRKTPLYGWRVALLPYLGEQARKLHGEFDLQQPWDSDRNKPLLVKMPEVFSLPSLPPTKQKKGWTHFQLLTGPRAAFHEDRKVTRADVRDGLDGTFLLVQTREPVPWTAPMDVVVPADPVRVEKEVLPRLGVFGEVFGVVLFDGTGGFLSRRLTGKTFLQAVDPGDGVGQRLR